MNLAACSTYIDRDVTYFAVQLNYLLTIYYFLRVVFIILYNVFYMCVIRVWNIVKKHLLHIFLRQDHLALLSHLYDDRLYYDIHWDHYWHRHGMALSKEKCGTKECWFYIWRPKYYWFDIAFLLAQSGCLHLSLYKKWHILWNFFYIKNYSI